MIRACFLIAILLLSVPSFSLTDTNSESQRFFIEGDGVVILENAHSKVRKTIRYKDKNTSQQEKYIRQVFGLNSKQKIDKIHLRLIALLDALQDRFQENHLIIISGYRSPSYNERLRKQGRTAAKASTHMEGMAADVIFPKNNPEKVWRHIKGLDCCGAGYYYGQSVHIDIGPSRYWTQKTAKVNKNISFRGDHECGFWFCHRISLRHVYSVGTLPRAPSSKAS
jgi:uncharacterized protein YcbK (DUF882 family)